ncbi:SDR family oxidoreductase [Cohnella lupini]|uniref:3-oxoacyl-[acyl-carrier protein] reductase n=1 Tax=Cohnella lupini TaxID=1294267 RepID=A0A3D9I217_9BACL|nr:SDR family oxidoreductase [Cohnella lupini]RED55685.1 3-oxoacyl-[acyl-carrier protein] reductase [Cohnella lupini]
MSGLQGKVALVTGASRGIGRGIALRLAQDGAIVAVHYANNKEAAEEVVREIQSNGGIAFAIGADLRDSDGVDAMFAEFDAAMKVLIGINPLDILVNNAGVGQALSIEETTEQSLNEVMSIHVNAPILIVQQALSRLRNNGRIINISSSATRIAMPSLLGYSVSKGAVNTLTHVLAQHLGDRKITVNAILPGIIDTDMNVATLQSQEGREFAAGLSAFGRWGQPDDVADIASFLSSSDSRWVTGQLIDASGGSRL